jgi:bifunctional non-homologous end joining protein LigD
MKVGPHIIKITHPDKMLFPDDGITKEELAEYYRRVADFMVPHVKGRPIIMYRFQDNIKSEGYYQQKIPLHAPSWVGRVTVKKEGGTVTHVACNNAATLVYLANQNCITPHVWLSRMDNLEKPDQIIFDLDPPQDDFESVRRGAKLLKVILDEMGLASYIKTTGSRGLHVVIPLKRTEIFNTVRSLAQDIAGLMTHQEPDKYTTEQRKEKRGNRLFIDTLRNTYGHSAVAPYAVRPIQGAPIAAPLQWEELGDKDLTARRYNIRNIFKRLEQTGDPWKDMERHNQNFDGLQQRLKAVKINLSSKTVQVF